ncbi:group II intron maturase-specific domain-containing protein [Paenibacillus sp. FSL H7-0331]|uniref:group II intron maturase-specific domain-containing protein n=1 Tax=Paenibacillus sp. FSL H7-0331 TaxID=1920421 RepID=UPI0030F6FD79
MNTQKSKVVSVVAQKHFKFLGFALGKNGKGVYVRAHHQSLGKAKKKLKKLTSRSQGRNARQVMENVKVYIRGWIGYFYVADMKRILQGWNEWLRRRMRMYHLEAMEEAEDEGAEPTKVRDTGVAGVPVGKHPIGLLADSRKRSVESLCNKRKARTGRILGLPCPVRAFTSIALKRLNRRIPNGTSDCLTTDC